MRITVLGATGGIGQAIVHELADRGHQVTAASRSAADRSWPTGVVAVATDVRDPAQTRAACREADVVVMAAQVPYQRWAAELPGLVDGAADAATEAGARFVMVDNLYAYGSPGTPLTSASPETAATRKGQLRAEIGRCLLARHEAGTLRVAIGRFSDYYGPYEGSSLLGQLIIDAAVRGRRPRTYIADDQPHTFHYLPDAARGFATLVERPEADGHIWLLPAAAPITQAEVVDLVAAAVGRPLRASRVSPTMLTLLGLVNPQLREARELVEQFDRPYIVDDPAFEATFGAFTTTPHAEALAATVTAAQARTGTAVAATTDQVAGR